MKRRNKAALASLLAAANLSSTAMPLAHAEEEKIEDSPVIEEVYETPVPEMELVYETPVNEEPIVEQPPVQETPITHDNNSINEGNNDNNYDDYHLDPIGQEIVNIDDNNYDDILLKPNDQEIIEINNDDNNTNTDEDKLDDEEKVESEKKYIGWPGLSNNTFEFDGSNKSVSVICDAPCSISGETTASEEGTYNVYVTLTNEDDYFVDDSKSYTLTWSIVAKQSLDETPVYEGIVDPDINNNAPFPFTNKVQSPTVALDAEYELRGETSATKPGTYTSTVHLTNPLYIFNSTNTQDYTFTWSIAECNHSLDLFTHTVKPKNQETDENYKPATCVAGQCTVETICDGCNAVIGSVIVQAPATKKHKIKEVTNKPTSLEDGEIIYICENCKKFFDDLGNEIKLRIGAQVLPNIYTKCHYTLNGYQFNAKCPTIGECLQYSENVGATLTVTDLAGRVLSLDDELPIGYNHLICTFTKEGYETQEEKVSIEVERPTITIEINPVFMCGDETLIPASISYLFSDDDMNSVFQGVNTGGLFALLQINGNEITMPTADARQEIVCDPYTFVMVNPGRVFRLTEVPAVPSTCKDQGHVKYYYEEINGHKSYFDENLEETNEEEILLPLVEHKPLTPVIDKNTVVMPTCTETGHHDEVVYCELCGKEISRKENVVDPAFGHAATYQNIIELAKEDCENKGLYQIDYVCSACNEVIDKKIFEKPALGHTVVSYISSLEKDGELNYYLENFCNRCGKEWKVSKIDFSKMDIPEDVRVRALELLCKIKSAPTFFKTISLVEKYNGDYKAYVKDQLDDVSLYTLFETAYELQQTEGIKDNGINDAMRNMEIQSDLAKKIEIEKSAYEKEPKRDNGEYVKDLTDLLPKDDKRIGDFADKILLDKNVKNENDIKKSVEDTFKKETILGMNEEMFDKEEMKKKLEAKTYNVIQSFSSKPSKDISIVEDGSKISLTWINIPTESEDIFKLEAKDEFASLKLRLNSNESNVTLVK